MVLEGLGEMEPVGRPRWGMVRRCGQSKKDKNLRAYRQKNVKREQY